MFRLASLGILIACVVLPHPAGAAPAQHVVLISVDGFRPDFYLDAAWPAPVIQDMAQNGVRAERVRSVFPSVTYPSHTTIVTGVSPARHGILFNKPFEPNGQTGRWYWEASAIRVPTVFSMLQDQGRRTAAVSWPVTEGAAIDWMIPEVWALEGDDRLAPMREGTRPVGLWAEIEKEATGALNASTYSASYVTRDLETAAAAAYLLETKKPALLALHLIGPDHFQHAVGRDGFMVRRAVATADSAIGAILDAATRANILDTTAFIITGDHGFVDLHTQVAPNVWLTELGLLPEDGSLVNWRARFHTAGGSAFLRLRNKDDRRALRMIRKRLDNLSPRMKRMFRVVDREEMDRIGADPESPLALAANLGIVFSPRQTGDLLAPATGGTHGYHPTDFPEIYTGFVGWGAGFKTDLTIHEMGLEDIAPTIAALLDFPMPEIEGIAPQGILAH